METDAVRSLRRMTSNNSHLCDGRDLCSKAEDVTCSPACRSIALVPSHFDCDIVGRRSTWAEARVDSLPVQATTNAGQNSFACKPAQRGFNRCWRADKVIWAKEGS